VAVGNDGIGFRHAKINHGSGDEFLQRLRRARHIEDPCG
jgi:hypothetical protein